jgi:hypothetical protein
MQMKQFCVFFLMLTLALSLPIAADAKRKPRRKASKPKPALLPIERRQLLRAVPDAALKAEIERRWLSLFTLAELQAEAERRRIR